MRIFVTGANGQVARALREAGEDASGVVIGCAARPAVDLTRPETLFPAMQGFRPDIVVNPAAYTAVDKAEAEPELAFQVNRDGAAAVASAAAQVGAPIVHLSTDYVFDGAKDAPYLEDDPVNPQGVYGRSKLAGEVAVAAANPRSIVLRTAWVFAPYGANFVRTMLRLAGERDRLRVVDDQIGCPTYAPHIAGAILNLCRRLHGEGWREAYAGVTHLAGPDAVTWCGFAQKIVAGSAARGGRDTPIEPITTAAYPTPAKRPANSRLATGRLAALFDVRLPSLDRALDDCLDRLSGERA